MTSRPFLVRLFSPFAVLLILIVAICGTVVHRAGERATRSQQIADLDRLTRLVRQWVPPQNVAALEVGAAQPGAADRARLTDAARLLATRVTLIDGGGRVLFDTDVPAERMDNHNDRPEIVAARREGKGSSVRDSHTLGEPSVYVAQLLDPHDPSGPVLRLSYPQRTWAVLGDSVWTVVGGAAAATLITLLLLSLMLQRQWITPTRRLARAAEQMAAGRWGQRVEPSGAEELAFFSTRLNLVASHAQQQLSDLNHKRADLQALVDTLPDPILVTDGADKLILINQPAARLLDLPKPRALGQRLIQVVNDEAVLQLFEQVRAGGTTATTSVGTTSVGTTSVGAPAGAVPAAGVPAAGGANDNGLFTRDIRLSRGGQRLTYQAVGTRTPGGGTLLVLRDVSALTAAVQMKTDFVANASHELRTPIAAIKIAFETLREVYGDDAQQSQRCMQIIEGHLGRLEEMLRDLLDLSKVERENLDLNVRPLKTADVFTHLRSSLGPMARQKGVELYLGEGGRAGPQAEGLLADEVLLNLVLKNLVENSIKFTPPGGSVRVTFHPVPGGQGSGAGESGGAGGIGDGQAPAVLLTVSDTGIGIPPEHLDRVFERFYQVDPARSGSAGRGTGLGLAIVKHAVAALGGTLHMQSTVGTGTEVSCALPQSKAGKPGSSASGDGPNGSAGLGDAPARAEGEPAMA